jgi:hypothetical protein
MGDIRNLDHNDNIVALVEAILGKRVAVEEPASPSAGDDYDHLADMEKDQSFSKEGPQPDRAPKDVFIGVANPYALVEALLGRQVDRECMSVIEVMQNVLQTDYDEMFDMKYRSVLYAGMKLNENERKAERCDEKEMKILREQDLITPDLSRVDRLEDLERIGLKDLKNVHVKCARMQNGKLRLVLQARDIGHTVTNRDITVSIKDLITPFRSMNERNSLSSNAQRWTPPNAEWRDMYDYFFRQVNKRLISDITRFRIGEHRETIRRFDDPVQGCTSNSWFVAALFSVFWSNPSMINRATRLQHDGNRDKRTLSVRFHDKGGRQNNKTETVEVNYELPINNSNNEPLYCRSSDGADIWPSLYEKAFAKWITGSNSEHPDITQTNSGDPIKAMAQINGREPHYFECDKHQAHDLLSLVRRNCVNNQTINPMAAFTYATGSHYMGANIVANHAYSVLGFCGMGKNQYIVVRNPWGVTELQGLTSCNGMLGRLDPEMWRPAALLDQGGVFALDPEAFKRVFAYVGVAK